MNILVACEFSGTVRDAFIAQGHRAVSCDLLPTESPGPHFQGDVFEALKLEQWDMMIAFPPCTYLCSSGLHWNRTKLGRAQKTLEALEFVSRLLAVDVPLIALENPVGCISSQIRKWDQIIHPWQFGHREQKTTCLWLKGLPLLKPTRLALRREQKCWRQPPGPDRWKKRSITYPGIASAMAKQWGNLT